MAICMDSVIPFVLSEPPPNSSAAVRRSIRYVTDRNRREKAAWLQRLWRIDEARRRQPRRNAA